MIASSAHPEVHLKTLLSKIADATFKVLVSELGGMLRSGSSLDVQYSLYAVH